MDHIAASQTYAKRTTTTFKANETTVLIDCDTGAILDLHCSTIQPHDSQVAWQLLRRNFEQLTTITTDSGYDSELLRDRIGSEGVKTTIKY